MSIDLELERLYRGVELVRGRGNPRKGRLCIMSLVAYLAGEGHTDRPRTASRVIRDFAVSLNDLAPAEWRQELKPFAPRIIGTNDGNDRARARLLHRAIIEEVIPKASADTGRAEEDDRQDADHSRACAPLGTAVPSDVSRWAAGLLGLLIRNAPSASARRWHWAKAVDILDRLCEVGAEGRLPLVRQDRIDRMRTAVEHRRAQVERIHHLMTDAKKLAHDIPQLCRTMVRHLV